MQNRNWPALVASIGAVYSVLTAMWPGGMIDRNGHQIAPQNLEWWFMSHMLAGALGIAAILLAYRWFGISRILLGAAALVLLALMATEPFHFLNVVTVVLPGLMMAAGAVAITPPNPAQA